VYPLTLGGKEVDAAGVAEVRVMRVISKTPPVCPDPSSNPSSIAKGLGFK